MTQSTERSSKLLRRRQRGPAAAAEREAQRQAFIGDAGALLAAATPDESMMLAAVARRCVPFLADWCVIDVLGSEGEFHRAAVVHEDASKVESAIEASERYKFDPQADHGPARVFRSGASIVYRTAEDIYSAVQDEEYASEIGAFGLRSVMCVPIVARGRTLGVITLATAESGFEFEDADLEVAEELGRRVGLALDNARLVAQLERALEAKNEFLGLISHELRTPITSIYSGAHLLRSRGDRLDSETLSEVVADISSEAERLFRMVEDLLALARIELGEKPELEPVLVQRVLQKVVNHYQDRKREVRLTVEGAPSPVAGRAGYIEHVVRNLISNADKYSPEGEPIDVLVCGDGRTVEIRVMDSGPGLSAEDLEKVFDRFYRSGTPRSTKGAGLGLTVCKRLVEAQSGTIEARNREEGGLTMSVTLPVYEEEAG